jgi:hypothetical protein
MWLKEQVIARLAYALVSLFGINLVINFAYNYPDYFPYFPMILYGVILFLRRFNAYWMLTQSKIDPLSFTNRTKSLTKTNALIQKEHKVTDWDVVEQNGVEMLDLARRKCIMLNRDDYGDLKLP